uniref:Reverse transcriptase domain-containing protein n=1 Tax=Vitis vinifera TaxID=29760 RepID=A5C916_VITVI|nr:hypothetical protein VITISV_010636 [Vitis vinifera]
MLCTWISGNFTLCSFPSLYAFASYKEAWLVELWDHLGEEGVWSPSFSRPFNDWEVEEVERLLLTIRGRRLNPLLEDRMLWKETKDGIFSVKSLYSTLASRRVVQFPNSISWSPCVPTKVCFFAWEASWGKFIKLANEEAFILMWMYIAYLKEEILLYFEKLYASPTGESWSVEGLDWSPISEKSALRLDSPFIEEEISKAIFQLDRDKAPGPDGFTIAVFQDCWDVIKEELVRVFAEFHRSGIINQSTNASFIVLLPKKSLTKKISDFRPISLITSLYKIIVKVLSGHLRGVLHETIHSTQGAFVQGRQILDTVLIANEIVDERRRSREEGVIFKIDFEKAHDHVRKEDLQTLKSLLLVFGAHFWAQVAAKIERLQRDFLWSGIGEGKRDHLVRWDVVCKPKAIGGLGFGNISLRNLALLGKWLWRYPREGSALWHQVILSIYGSHSNGWDANTLVRWSHRCPWKAIAQVFQEFSLFTRSVVGNRERIRLWEDLWWGDQPLGTQYPRLFRVVLDKNILISSVLGSTRPFSWNLNFRRNLSYSEIEDLEGLMRLLDGLHLSPSVPDARFWPLSFSGLFSVKSFFLALSQFSGSP